MICAGGPQVGRIDCERDQFYNEMVCEWGLQNHIGSLSRDFNGDIERRIYDFQGVRGRKEIAEGNVHGRRLLE